LTGFTPLNVTSDPTWGAGYANAAKSIDHAAPAFTTNSTIRATFSRAIRIPDDSDKVISIDELCDEGWGSCWESYSASEPYCALPLIATDEDGEKITNPDIDVDGAQLLISPNENCPLYAGGQFRLKIPADAIYDMAETAMTTESAYYYFNTIPDTTPPTLQECPEADAKWGATDVDETQPLVLCFNEEEYIEAVSGKNITFTGKYTSPAGVVTTVDTFTVAMTDTNQVTVYEDESTVEVRLLSDPTDVDSEPRKWTPNTFYTIAIDAGAIIDGAGNRATFNRPPPSAPSTGRRKLTDPDAAEAASVTSPSFRTVNGRRRKLAAPTTIAQPPARALGYTTGCSEGPTLVGLTSVVTGTSVVVTARFTSSSALILKADQKIVVLNNATRGLANMFAPNANFVTYPAMTATPAPTNDYSVVFTLPPLEGPATYVMGWDSGTWVDSKGNAASALSFKEGLFGFTIVNNATNCDSGSTWSSTGLTPCTACSTCMESGVTSLCNRNTDANCSTTVPQRSAAMVMVTLVAAGSESDYMSNATRTNLQIKFAQAAGVPPSFFGAEVMQVAAGSVMITAFIAVPVGSSASGVTNALATTLGSTSAASSFLGITVTSAPTFTSAVPPTSPSTNSDNSLALPLGLGLGLGLGGCLVLFALFMLFKRHSAKVDPDKGKVEA
jgi:hypothetical protein